jgi:hypothetical protein
MVTRQPRYSKEEFAQKGDYLYETQIRPQIETSDRGKIVAIDDAIIIFVTNPTNLWGE